MWTRRQFLAPLALFGTGAAMTANMALWANGSSAIRTEPWARRLIEAALAQIGVTLRYDPAYAQLDFPGGDVSRERGVCTDVVVRAYRDGLNIDLQERVNADMKANFSAYPKIWGLKAPDSNIDHRRVPNLRTFFERHAVTLPVSNTGADYRPGDLVTQMLPANRPHIMIVANVLNANGDRPLVVHNIGWGTRLEDVLFSFDITGHYRFSG